MAAVKKVHVVIFMHPSIGHCMCSCYVNNFVRNPPTLSSWSVNVPSSVTFWIFGVGKVRGLMTASASCHTYSGGGGGGGGGGGRFQQGIFYFVTILPSLGGMM